MAKNTHIKQALIAFFAVFCATGIMARAQAPAPARDDRTMNDAERGWVPTVSTAVALLLLLMSVASWVVIAWKAWLLRRAGGDVGRGIAAFWQAPSLDDARQRLRHTAIVGQRRRRPAAEERAGLGQGALVLAGAEAQHHLVDVAGQVAGATGLVVQAGHLAQRGQRLQVERLARGPRLLGAVQDRDRPGGGGQGLHEVLDGEGVEEADLEQAKKRHEEAFRVAESADEEYTKAHRSEEHTSELQSH